MDVGYGQFAWKLRTDERVVCMERTNIRYVTPEDIGEKPDFASIDVSFISLRTIMPSLLQSAHMLDMRRQLTLQKRPLKQENPCVN